MKKIIFFITLITLSIIIASCSNKQVKQPTSNNISSQVSTNTPTQQITPTPIIYNNMATPTPISTMPITTTPIPLTPITTTPTEALKCYFDVMQNKIKINQESYKDNYDEGIMYQPFYLDDLIDKIGIEQVGFDESWNPYLNKFAILDMDGDKIPEVVIEIDSSCDGFYEVLHYDNGKVYGYYFVYRAMEALKDDGTYICSGGAANNNINNLSFSSDSLSLVTLAYSDMTDKYFIMNEPVTNTEFELYCDKQNAKTDATWYDFNTSNIEKYLNQTLNKNHSETEKIYKDYTAMDIKDVIIQAINNDIWYDGEKSYYYDFQDKEFGFELYDEDNFPDSLHVVFTNKAGYINFDCKVYFALTLNYNNGGFSTTDIGFCNSIDLDEIRGMLTDVGGLIYSGKINFGKVAEPYIQSNVSDKDKIVASIKAEFNYFMDDFDKGSYDAKIVNFTTFDNVIYMILENAYDKWLIVFSNWDGEISFFKSFDSADPDSDFAYHPINQYEKNVLEEFTFSNK